VSFLRGALTPGDGGSMARISPVQVVPDRCTPLLDPAQPAQDQKERAYKPHQKYNWCDSEANGRLGVV
jgi:hypothetical protein